MYEVTPGFNNMFRSRDDAGYRFVDLLVISDICLSDDERASS